MRFLLENFFSSSWFLIIVLLAAMVLLFLSSFSRRKKEEQYHNELATRIVKGAKVKTYSGLYGTVVSVRSTTDGKIVLIETGEGDKKSYQQLHINAIYGLDESEDMVIDSEGNEVPMSALNAEPNEKKVEVEEKVEAVEEKAEEVEKPAKKTTKKAKDSADTTTKKKTTRKTKKDVE